MSGTLLENGMGMNFQLSENQQMIADMIRKFGKEHILPKMMEWDESQEFPVEVFKKLGEKPFPHCRFVFAGKHLNDGYTLHYFNIMN